MVPRAVTPVTRLDHTGGTVDTVELVETAVVEDTEVEQDDVLVEDVSIDGMCGVY